MSDPIVPGPCPSTGCPPPTEIDCIMVEKLYDYCFQQDTIQTTPIVFTCASGTPTATCSVTSTSCTFSGSTPSGTANFVNATFVISLTVVTTITCGATTSTTTFTQSFAKTVVLCGPAGTTQDCQIVATSCGPCAVLPTGDDDQIVCPLVICTTFISFAEVALLVPTYGFCSPAPCSTTPVLPCPPSPLFPPQCV